MRADIVVVVVVTIDYCLNLIVVNTNYKLNIDDQNDA